MELAKCALVLGWHESKEKSSKLEHALERILKEKGMEKVKQVLHIVEVKSRKADGLTAPEEAMTRKKFNALFRAAQQYVALYRIDADTQFDLIAVDLLPDSTHRLRYIPNAMVPRW